MKDTFHFIQKPYNLRNDPELQRRRNRTVYFRTESISSLAPKIWELVPSDIRSANSLEIFKEKIKFWTRDKCPCRLVKRILAMWVSFKSILKKLNILPMVSIYHHFQ